MINGMVKEISYAVFSRYLWILINNSITLVVVKLAQKKMRKTKHMETFQINIEFDKRREIFDVTPIGDGVETSRYEISQDGKKQAEVWTETTDLGLVWHTEDMLDEATLERIGEAIERQEI